MPVSSLIPKENLKNNISVVQLKYLLIFSSQWKCPYIFRTSYFTIFLEKEVQLDVNATGDLQSP